MLTYGEERSLLEDIKEGIEIAMHRCEYPTDAIDDIKVNKLAYFAIREFDLDITFGWFKYGPAPVDVANRTADRGPAADISPQSKTEITASSRSRVPSEREVHPSPEEYAEFFVEFDEFHKILTTDTKSYLREFYKEYAPEKYKDLYLSSIELQLLIDQIEENPQLAEWDEKPYAELSNRLNRLYGEILQIPQLDEAIEPFQSYGRLLKNVVSKAQQRDDLLESEEQFIGQVVSFFYNNTWYYIALLISDDTVSGDNADRLRNSIEDDLGQLRNRYNQDIDRLEEHSRLFGLQPSSRKAVKEAQENSNSDTDGDYEPSNPEKWAKLGSRVINQ